MNEEITNVLPCRPHSVGSETKWRYFNLLEVSLFPVSLLKTLQPFDWFNFVACEVDCYDSQKVL